MYVFVSGNDLSLYRVFSKFGGFTRDKILFTAPEKVSLVVFPGGADINPSMYGYEAHSMTMHYALQDRYDTKVFEQALRHNIPMAGICRGAQFLVAKAGGALYQHTTGHHRSHTVLTNDGRIFGVTSSHHQMFGLPLPKGAELLAWSEHRRSAVYEVGPNVCGPALYNKPVVEPECVYLPSIRALATQWHPEWMKEESEGRRYVVDLVDKLLFDRHGKTGEQRKESASDG